MTSSKIEKILMPKCPQIFENQDWFHLQITLFFIIQGFIVTFAKNIF